MSLFNKEEHSELKLYLQIAKYIHQKIKNQLTKRNALIFGIERIVRLLLTSDLLY